MNKEMYIKYLRLKNRYAYLHNRSDCKDKAPEKDIVPTRLGLSRSQGQLMAMIYFQGPQQMKQIAQHFYTPMPNATRLANSMIEKNLCVKITKPGKRAVWVELTDEGKAAMEEHLDISSAEPIALLNRYIPQDEQEELLRLYSRLNEIISQLPIE